MVKSTLIAALAITTLAAGAGAQTTFQRLVDAQVRIDEARLLDTDLHPRIVQLKSEMESIQRDAEVKPNGRTMRRVEKAVLTRKRDALRARIEVDRSRYTEGHLALVAERAELSSIEDRLKKH
jgi:hypothetical protein